MSKTKRMIAVVLATTMVLGSSLAAFAADPVTNGGTNGAGTSEGHVNKHVISVTLPTIADSATPFAYTMDPERLVDETNAAKYADATFTDEAKKNGVYFKTADNNYDNKSVALKATSESSADVKLTVDVEVESADTDIKLVDTAPTLDGEGATTEAQLYLALKVGEETKAVKSTEKVSIETTISGNDANFDTTVENGEYVYKAKADASQWNEAEIQMSGVVSKASAEGLTAPTLKVTWKYEDPAATPAEPTVALSGTYSRGSTENAFTLSGLGTATITKIEALNSTNEVFAPITSDMYTLTGTTLKINGVKAPWGAGAVGQTRGIKISLSDGKTAQTTFKVEA